MNVKLLEALKRAQTSMEDVYMAITEAHDAVSGDPKPPSFTGMDDLLHDAMELSDKITMSIDETEGRRPKPQFRRRG